MDKTPTNARDLILAKLVELPAKEALDHEALKTLLVIDEVKPVLHGLAAMVAASRSAQEGRAAARFEQEQAEAARANAHQAALDAVTLAERQLGLEERQERLLADRQERAARRNGSSLS